MGAPSVHPRVYAFLKANPGLQFTPREIAEKIGHVKKGEAPGAGVTSAMKTVLSHHPSTVKRFPIGRTGRLARYAYIRTGSAPGTIAVAAPSSGVDDVLLTIPIGDNKSATLTMPQARKVWEQLTAVFGGGAK